MSFSCNFKLSALVLHIDYYYNPFIGFDSRNRDSVTVFFKGLMRNSKVEKAKTHKRIVAIAAKRFREEGIAGIGIAEPVSPWAASTSTSNRVMT
jgi:hypothetical protein